MSAERLGPIDAELDRLLEAERVASPSPAALDRVWERVAVSVGPGVGPAPQEGPDHEHANDLGIGGPSKSGFLATHAGSVALVAFVGGGFVGAAIHAALQRPAPERVVYVERPYPSEAPAPSPPPAQLPVAASGSASPPAAGPPAHASAVAPSGSSLSAERAILDGARSALTAGEAARALSLLDQHARRFPRPQLGEEREALAVQTMVAAGRYDEARARAARFRTAAPNSLFLPAIEASLASIP
jgi:hypothetical protein